MTYAAIFRLLRVLWPLIKEGLFGKENVSDVIRKNKATSAWMLAGAVCFFAMMTFVLDYYELEHLYRAELETQDILRVRVHEFELAVGMEPGDPIPAELYSKEEYDLLVKELDDLHEEMEGKSCKPSRPRTPARNRADRNNNEQMLQDLRGLW